MSSSRHVSSRDAACGQKDNSHITVIVGKNKPGKSPAKTNPEVLRLSHCLLKASTIQYYEVALSECRNSINYSQPPRDVPVFGRALIVGIAIKINLHQRQQRKSCHLIAPDVPWPGSSWIPQQWQEKATTG